jgi:succinyl-diaminopimelate desuccinylase
MPALDGGNLMRLEQEIDGLKEELIKAVQSCIQIRSVKDVGHATLGAPFGPGIKDCLEWALDLGERLGFTVKNVDGYAGHIEMGSGELFGILGHLDVVPEGDGWSVPPYSGHIMDNRIYGRGAIDDKGPTLAALFAMKAIKDSGLLLNKTIRLILGTDEESGWADMDYYKHKEQIPVMGFAPDAEFPLIHAEKGILHIELSKKFSELPHLVRLNGGERANVVPDVCRIVLRDISESEVNKQLNIFQFPKGVFGKIEKPSGEYESEVNLVFQGMAAHGSLPENGLNAVIYALKFLKTLPLSSEEISLVEWLIKKPGTGFHGEGFDIALRDEPSGELSLNLGIMNLSGSEMRFVIDIRYPVTYQKEDILHPLASQADEAGLFIKIISNQPAHYVPKDSPLVESLLKAYSDVTGLDAYAFAIGGGTYAKVLPQGVAFGPVIPGEPGGIHCPDEYISLDNLVLATKVYAQAILNIAHEPSLGE